MSLDQPEIRYQLQWNESEHGWQLVGTGDMVSTAAIHQEVRNHAVLSSTMFDTMTVQLYQAQIAVSQWQNAMLAEIKDGHIADAIFGAGGIGNMTPEAYARVEATLAKEAKYLAEFAQGISDGTVSELQARARARQYAQAMEQSYWNEWKAGLDVPEFSNLPLLENVPGDGNTQCHGNCQCVLLFNADGIEWSLNVAEHCPDCISLAAGGPYRVV